MFTLQEVGKLVFREEDMMRASSGVTSTIGWLPSSSVLLTDPRPMLFSGSKHSDRRETELTGEGGNLG